MTEMPDLADLGLQPVAEDVLDTAHALRLARTLDYDDDILAEGVLPLTWIWVYFTPTTPTSALRVDGHPRSTGSGPLAGLDRRMFVGGRLERHRPIRLDVVTERSSAITDAEHKHGSTGDFVVVSVEHRYHQAGALVLVERQQILYRAAAASSVPQPGSPSAPPPSAGLRQEIRPDERLLFRYSALTFNTHRIHYDRGYATDIEGYPGIVVHGPLTATLLAGLAAQQLGAPLTSFSFRATAPTFADTAMWLFAVPADDTPPGELTVRAVRQDGVTVMNGAARTA